MDKIDRYNESRQSKLLNQFEDDNLILEIEHQNDQISQIKEREKRIDYLADSKYSSKNNSISNSIKNYLNFKAVLSQRQS